MKTKACRKLTPLLNDKFQICYKIWCDANVDLELEKICLVCMFCFVVFLLEFKKNDIPAQEAQKALCLAQSKITCTDFVSWWLGHKHSNGLFSILARCQQPSEISGSLRCKICVLGPFCCPQKDRPKFLKISQGNTQHWSRFCGSVWGMRAPSSPISDKFWIFDWGILGGEGGIGVLLWAALWGWCSM